jgi:hypothetical protein
MALLFYVTSLILLSLVFWDIIKPPHRGKSGEGSTPSAPVEIHQPHVPEELLHDAPLVFTPITNAVNSWQPLPLQRRFVKARQIPVQVLCQRKSVRRAPPRPIQPKPEPIWKSAALRAQVNKMQIRQREQVRARDHRTSARRVSCNRKGILGG